MREWPRTNASKESFTSGHQAVLHSFTGGADGGMPTNGVALDSVGNIYGTTPFGGSESQTGLQDSIRFGSARYRVPRSDTTKLAIWGPFSQTSQHRLRDHGASAWSFSQVPVARHPTATLNPVRLIVTWFNR